jgi:hypothetical protein
MPLLNQSTTVQNIIDQLGLHTNLQNFFVNNGIVVTFEPGMTICNKTNQMLLAKSKSWKFNRCELSGPPNNPAGNFFVTQYGLQDYLHAGACAFSIAAPASVVSASATYGGVGIDLKAAPVGGGTAAITSAGGTVTVQTLQQHPFAIGSTVYLSGCVDAVYNSVFTFNGFTASSAWTNGYVVTAVPDLFHFQFAAGAGQTISSGAPGIINWGWGESAYLTDPSSQAFPQPISKMDLVDRLAPSYYSSGEPTPRICMLLDQNNGILKFRLGEPYGSMPIQINLVYQARATKLLLPTDIIQWPDNLSFCFHETALWLAYRFAKSVGAKETQIQMQTAQAAIMSCLQGDDNEDSGQTLVPDRGLMSF